MKVGRAVLDLLHRTLPHFGSIGGGLFGRRAQPDLQWGGEWSCCPSCGRVLCWGLKGEEVEGHSGLVPDEIYLVAVSRMLPAAEGGSDRVHKVPSGVPAHHLHCHHRILACHCGTHQNNPPLLHSVMALGSQGNEFKHRLANASSAIVDCASLFVLAASQYPTDVHMDE